MMKILLAGSWKVNGNDNSGSLLRRGANSSRIALRPISKRAAGGGCAESALAQRSICFSPPRRRRRRWQVALFPSDRRRRRLSPRSLCQQKTMGKPVPVLKWLTQILLTYFFRPNFERGWTKELNLIWTQMLLLRQFHPKVLRQRLICRMFCYCRVLIIIIIIMLLILNPSLSLLNWLSWPHQLCGCMIWKPILDNYCCHDHSIVDSKLTLGKNKTRVHLDWSNDNSSSRSGENYLWRNADLNFFRSLLKLEMKVREKCLKYLESGGRD